jgi:hypothetical protein
MNEQRLLWSVRYGKLIGVLVAEKPKTFRIIKVVYGGHYYGTIIKRNVDGCSWRDTPQDALVSAIAHTENRIAYYQRQLAELQTALNRADEVSENCADEIIAGEVTT